MADLPDRGQGWKSNLLAMHIEQKKIAERERDQAIRLASGLRLELELERQRSAALAFQLNEYRERHVL